MWIKVRVRKAEIGFAEEMAFLARRRGVRYAGEVQRVYALGLSASLAVKIYRESGTYTLSGRHLSLP